MSFVQGRHSGAKAGKPTWKAGFPLAWLPGGDWPLPPAMPTYRPESGTPMTIMAVKRLAVTGRQPDHRPTHRRFNHHYRRRTGVHHHSRGRTRRRFDNHRSRPAHRQANGDMERNPGLRRGDTQRCHSDCRQTQHLDRFHSWWFDAGHGEDFTRQPLIDLMEYWRTR